MNSVVKNQLTNIVTIVVLTVLFKNVRCEPIPRLIGSDVLSEVPLIDGHNDFPYNLYLVEKDMLGEFNFDRNLTEIPKWASRSSHHTDLPKLRLGKVGGQFWVAFVGCETNYKDAVEQTMAQIDVIKRLVQRYPNNLKLVTTADGIWEAFNEKKLASMICVEGGHSIDSRMSVLRLYHELGVRYLSLTHNCNTPWAENNLMDSVTDGDVNRIPDGLTEWGKKVILEMNRIGIMVDLAHVSKGVMETAIRISKAPVIFSHSSAYSIKNHTRNVQDDVLLKLKPNGGIIMVNFYPGFIGADNATIEDVIKHLNHIKNLIGPDHIGIGADYDGVGSTPVGLENVSKYPVLFDKLAEGGADFEPWTRDELQKLAGLNLIRVFKEVERVRDSMQASTTAVFDEPIPEDDIRNSDTDLSCRTDISKSTINQPHIWSLFMIIVAFIIKY